MRYLIDGYNLMHALSMIPSLEVRPARLQPIRERFLHRMSTRAGSLCPQLTVVFDATNAPMEGPEENVFREIRIIYTRDELADDRIEAMLAKERRPQDLTVVSDDRRLQRAAGRRRCSALGSLEFYETLAVVPEEPDEPNLSSPPEPEVSEEETRHWLEEFGVDPDSTDEEPW